jgi:hypothetical protein
MDGYTKLHAKIVHSSIWSEPHHVRLLWITMLAVADAAGNIEASVGGLSHLARITKAEAVDALAALKGPDDDSTDGSNGERVTELSPGIYHIINHKHYRDRQTRRQALDAERKRVSRATHTEGKKQHIHKTQTQSPRMSVDKADKSASSDTAKKAGNYSEGFELWWHAYPRRTGKGEAFKSWKKSATSTVIRRAIMAATTELARITTDKKFVPNPATWLNQRRWEDDQAHSAAATPRDSKSPSQDRFESSDHSGPQDGWDS